MEEKFFREGSQELSWEVTKGGKKTSYIKPEGRRFPSKKKVQSPSMGKRLMSSRTRKKGQCRSYEPGNSIRSYTCTRLPEDQNYVEPWKGILILFKHESFYNLIHSIFEQCCKVSKVLKCYQEFLH